MKLPQFPTHSRHRRRALVAALLCMTPFAAASAQTIGVNAGATGSMIVAPNAKVTVPVIVDLSSAGALTIAGLQTSITWGTNRLTLDSLVPVVIAGWSNQPNTSGAASGSSLFAAFGASALPATSTLANAYFTASATTGGTRVYLDPTTAVSAVGGNILSSIRARSLDVCIGTAAKWGDVNDDGLVNIADAQQIGRFSVGLSVVNPTALAQRGDVTADGVINISDAQQVARFSVGLPASPRLGTDLPIAAATTSITVSPNTAQTLVVGADRQVVATPLNAGTDLSGCAAVTWTTNNAAVATVNSSGYVNAISAGAATITATSGGFSSAVTFNVTAVPVATVSLSLAPTAIQVGTTSTSTATTRDASNNVLAGRVITYSSSNTAVATVNASTGVVTGVAAGSATIFATSEGITGSATVTVTTGIPTATVTVALGSGTINAGATTTATATARDAGNNVLAGKVVTWSSSNTGIATVNPATGVVTGVSGGSASIIATIDGIQGQAIVSVTAVPVASVTVTLAQPSIGVGTSTQATAVMRDAANNILNGRVVSFTSNNSSVATVGAFTGVVSGVAAGTATIFATSEGITGQVTVTVTSAGAVSTVSVALGSSNIQSGSTTTSVATLRDASNNVISGTVTWASSAPSIATVNSTTGVVTGLTAGNATITATTSGKQGQANITITTVPVASVAVTLAPASITVGGTSTGTATTFDAGGNVLTGRVIAWSSTNTAVATVNATTGVITGVAIGTATIRATSESRIGSSTVTVSVVPVAQVSVTLGASSVQPGGTTSATAITRDASSNVLSGRTVTWTSSNTAVATVSSTTGVVTAVAAGTANIIATSEGVTGQAGLTVASSSVASISISLSAVTIGVAGTATATAVARDAAGNTLSGVNITFSSSNTGTATVNSTSGAISGVAVGSTNIVATSGSVTGQAALSVASVVSNEPTGFSLLAEKAMNCIKPTACESNWYYAEDTPGSSVLIADAAAPRSPGNVIQQNFTSALPGGSSPAIIGTGLGNKGVVYVSIWMKMSDNYVGHPTGVNKSIHFWTSNGRNIVVFIIRGVGTGPLQASFNLQNLAAPYPFFDGTRTVSSTEVNLDANLNPCPVARGTWNRYEMLVKNNSNGVADGRIEYWMNGVKCGDYQNLQFVAAGQNNLWEEIMWSPTWGGIGGTITDPFYIQMDHIYVSGR